MQINFLKEIVTKDISVISTEDRIFEGIATVEMVDKQGEITARDALLKQFPIWMKRGAPIMDTHTNRHIGKGLNYSAIEVIDPNSKKKYYGIKIIAQIFKDNELDNQVWNYIKSGVYKGLSFGGSNRAEREPIKQADGSLAYKLNDLELYEMSVCPEPAVPLAVITDFNKVAKSASMDELQKMDVIEDGDRLLVKCRESRCFVLSGDPEEHIKNKQIIAKEDETFTQKSDQSADMVIKGSVDINTKDMKTEEKLQKEKDESEEYSDEEDKKSTKVKEEANEEVISEEEDDKEEKAVDKLASIVGKYIDQSLKKEKAIEKRFADLEKKLDKALETPAPADDHANNSKVKLPNDYVDAEQGSGDPKDADSEGEEDKVSMEEKSEEVIASRKNKSNDWTQSERAGTQTVAGQRRSANAVLRKARELGANGLGDLANLINKGEFGEVKQSGFGEGYPEV